MSDAHGVARDQLRSFIERIERLEEEKKTIADDIKDVYGEAKGMGFDAKILKEVIKIRKMDRDDRMEREAILDTYLAALGMIEQPDFFSDEPVAANPTRSPAMALQSPRNAAEAVAERPALNPVANVGEEFADESAASSVDPASRTDDVRERQYASTVGFADDCRTGGKEQVAAAPVPVGEADARSLPANFEPDGGAISEVKAMSLENADGVEPPPSVTAPKPAPSMDELRIANALILRSNCKRPGQETCGGQGRTHCRDCIAAPVEREREEA
jgi:uncharacterized protein (UPF0335 family)